MHQHPCHSRNLFPQLKLLLNLPVRLVKVQSVPKKIVRCNCYAVLVIAPVPCCSQKSNLCSLNKDINRSIFHTKDFLGDPRGLRNGGGPLPPPTLVVNQLDPDMIKKAVFDVRDRAQKVMNANGGYIEKV